MSIYYLKRYSIISTFLNLLSKYIENSMHNIFNEGDAVVNLLTNLFISVR